MEEVKRVQVASWAPEIAHTWDAHEQLAQMLLMRREQSDEVDEKTLDLMYALQVLEEAMAIYPNRYMWRCDVYSASILPSFTLTTYNNSSISTSSSSTVVTTA